MNYTPRTSCRICGDNATLPLVPFLDLNSTPLADRFKKSPMEGETWFPLRVAYCPNCHLAQLMDDVNEDLLWNDEYAFYTGASPSSIGYFKDYALDTIERHPDLIRGLIVEIASNDGTYLKHFVDLGYNALGIEPTENTAKIARGNGVNTLVKLFNTQVAQEIRQTMGQASLIIGSNVLAHVPDLNDFVEGVKDLLIADGVAIFEVQYFPHLIFNNAFDHVYHEHRSYFSLHPLVRLFEKHNMRIFDVVTADTQGGSIRIFVSKKRRNIKSSVTEMLWREAKIGVLDVTLYRSMQYHVDFLREELVRMVNSLNKRGKIVHGYGASAKGNTLLNYCGFKVEDIPYIEDLTPFKIGKYTPGTNIPVVKPGSVETPDYYLVQVWNYLQGILEREKTFLEKGHLLLPIPMPTII